MNIRELIEELSKYNPDAEFEVLLDGQIPMNNYTLYYGGKHNVTPLTCKTVTLNIVTNELL